VVAPSLSTADSQKGKPHSLSSVDAGPAKLLSSEDASGAMGENGAIGTDADSLIASYSGDDGWQAAYVTDIAQDGCTVSQGLAVRPNDGLAIMFPGFQARTATVEWVRDGRVGCIFVEPIPLAILDHILRMSDPDARG
jgi:hypothetical protein